MTKLIKLLKPEKIDDIIRSGQENTLSESTNSQQDVFKLIQSYLYYNSNAAIDSGKPVNAEPTTCSISIIVVCGTNV